MLILTKAIIHLKNLVAILYFHEMHLKLSIRQMLATFEWTNSRNFSISVVFKMLNILIMPKYFLLAYLVNVIAFILQCLNSIHFKGIYFSHPRVSWNAHATFLVFPITWFACNPITTVANMSIILILDTAPTVRTLGKYFDLLNLFVVGWIAYSFGVYTHLNRSNRFGKGSHLWYLLNESNIVICIFKCRTKDLISVLFRFVYIIEGFVSWLKRSFHF